MNIARVWLAFSVLLVLALGAAGGRALVRQDREARAELQNHASARLRGVPASLEALWAEPLDRAEAALGRGPWRPGPALEARCREFARAEPRARAVLVADPEGHPIHPAPADPPRLPPPPWDPLPAGRYETDSPADLRARARRAAPSEARNLIARIESDHGPLASPWGVDWAFVAAEERLRLSCILGRSVEVATGLSVQTERLLASQGTAAATAYLERFLASPQPSLLAAANRDAVLDRLHGFRADLALDEGARAFRTVWEAARPALPPAGGFIQLDGAWIRVGAMGPHGVVAVVLDGELAYSMLKARVDALRTEEEPLGLLDAGRVVTGAAPPPGTWTTEVRLGPPWEGLALVAWVPEAAERALDARARGYAILGGIGVAALLAAVLAIGRVLSERLRLAQLRSDFVSAVSHELRTPLTAVRMFAETLAEERVPGKEAAYGKLILKEAARMERMVGRILGFARAERGRMSPRLEVCDLVSIVPVMVQEYARVDGGAIAIEAGDGPLPCRAAPEALTEAVWNLLENARRYSPDGEAVTVTLRREEGQAVLAVADHGIGVPEDERERIFEPFFRGSHPRVRAAGGTGLGLARVREVVRAHGGTVGFESRPGEGSTFWIRLPLSQETTSRAPVPDERVPATTVSQEAEPAGAAPEAPVP